jgi:hypothetical protein
MSIKRFFGLVGVVAALSAAACGGSNDVEFTCYCSTTESGGTTGPEFNTVVCADSANPPYDQATQQCNDKLGSSTTCSCECTEGTSACTPK